MIDLQNLQKLEDELYKALGVPLEMMGKEESKQETVEEADERMYSEEDMAKAF